MKNNGIKVLALVLAMVVVFSFSQVFAAAAPTQAETITISTAASMQEAMFEIRSQFEQANRNINVHFNFGATGTLKKQIEEGAPVDLFIAADTKSIGDLDSKNLVVKGSKRNIAANDIVLLVNKEFWGKIGKIEDLTKADVKNIAIGVPESVPAGAYAKESLSYYKLWEQVMPKLVYGKDVKQVMTYVETGDAMAGFVYYSDAVLRKNSVMVQVAPKASHAPILYSSAVISASKHQTAAQQFQNYLGQKKAQEIFKKYGFRMIK